MEKQETTAASTGSLTGYFSSFVKQIGELSTISTQTLSSATSAATSIILGNDNIQKKRKNIGNLEIYYITNRVIAMGFPVNDKLGIGPASYAKYFQDAHGHNYMVFDFGEQAYDSSCFASHISYMFPGHPSPPLRVLFKICASMESWLANDPENVVVIHCATGKGRTATMIACLLAWIGEISSPTEALQYICEQRGKGEDVDSLAIPSQRRYIQYFGWVLEGIKPHVDPLRLKRIVIQPVPNVMAVNEGLGDGLRPIIQIYTNGKLLFASHNYDDSTENTSNNGSNKEFQQALAQKLSKIQSYHSKLDSCITIDVDLVVEGDILFRCRHVNGITGKCSSVFRAAFHTGYVPSGILRLTASKLDGACSDPRFVYLDDFHVDLIFGPAVSPISGMANNEGSEKAIESYQERLPFTELADTNFWNEIEKKKEKRLKQGVPLKAKKDTKGMEERNPFTIADEESPSFLEMELTKQERLNNETLKMELMELTSATNNSSDPISPKPPTQDNSVAKKATPKTQGSDNIMNELETLEMELMMSSSSSSTTTKPSTQMKPQKILQDDDLNELEEYLSGINSNVNKST